MLTLFGDAALAPLGLCIILVLLAVIMAKRMSPLIALILIPFLGAMAGGFTPVETSKFVLEGLRAIVPAAGMFVFAILFFGVMSDAGMLDPIIDWIVKKMGSSPPRITIGTVILTLLIHLDGSGAVTFMLAIPALLPIYDRLGMQRRILACLLALAAGVNVLPWVGPMIRASAVLNVPATTIFNPLIPVQCVGLGFVLLVAYIFGKREEKRLGLNGQGAGQGAVHVHEIPEDQKALRRPQMFWVNIFITIAVIVCMVMNWLSAVLSFMLGLAFALVLNYRDVKMQKARIDAHSKTALMMASILMAAGVFVGIMKNSGMIKAMAGAVVSGMSAEMGQHIPFILGIVGMPLTLFFDPDSFYFGVMPIIAEVYQTLGGDPIQVAQAALLGACTTGFPVSPLTPATFLLVGLLGLDLGEHQKFAIPFLWSASIIMTFASVIFGVFPL
jgi:citrate transporter, CitMHS family